MMLWVNSGRGQGIQIFNEIASSLYLYVLIVLTDFHGVNILRNELGWGLLFIVSFVVLINLGKLF